MPLHGVDPAPLKLTGPRWFSPRSLASLRTSSRWLLPFPHSFYAQVSRWTSRLNHVALGERARPGSSFTEQILARTLKPWSPAPELASLVQSCFLCLTRSTPGIESCSKQQLQGLC